MTGSPEEFEDRIRRVLNEAAGQLPVRRAGWEGPSQPRRWAFPRPGLGGIATAVGIAVVAAVVVIALGALKHSPATPAGTPKPAPKPTGPVRFNTSFPACGAGHAIARPEQGSDLVRATGAPSKALLASLAVLRRQARPSDRLSKSELRPIAAGAYVAYIRLAQTVAGTSYYVVPIAGVRVPKVSQRCKDQVRAAVLRGTSTPAGAPDPALIAKARQLQRVIGPSPSHGGLCVLAAGRDGSTSGNCVSALPSVPYLAFRAASDANAIFGAVPDGVARVTARFARSAVTAVVVDEPLRHPDAGARRCRPSDRLA